MKVLALLEGIIQVPKSSMDQLMTAVSADYLSRIITYLNSDAGSQYDDNILKFEKYADEYRKRYGDFDLQDMDDEKYTTHDIRVKMNELDPKYLSRHPNLKNASYTIVASLMPSDNADPSGEYLKRSKRFSAGITIHMPSSKHIQAIARSPEYFPSVMKRLEGVAQHELMHAIQDMAWKEIPDRPAYYDAAGKIDDDKYHTDKIEFSPLIATAATEFKAYLSDLKSSGWEIGPNTRKKLIMKYVNPDAPSASDITPNTNKFFATLLSKSKNKWRKAVKYFYSLIQ